VTNESSNDMSVVDLTTATVTDTIAVGNAPRKIVVQSAALAAAPQPTPVAQVAPTPPAAPEASVTAATIAQFAFNPATVTVASGQSVTWTNTDPVQHTTTSDSPAWDSGPLPPGATFNMTFTTPGTFAYHCNIHPFMHGTVIVTS
jgi:YVTN family beta-propeller protein